MKKLFTIWFGSFTSYESLMTRLSDRGVFSGNASNRTNLRMMRGFFEIRTRTNDTRRTGRDLFIKITPEGCEWWILEGPSLGVEIPWDAKKNSHFQICHAKAQLCYFIDIVLRDRHRLESVFEYEKAAALADLDPYSGSLVTLLVSEAQKLLGEQRHTESGVNQEKLSHSLMQQARGNVFANLLETSKKSQSDTMKIPQRHAQGSMSTYLKSSKFKLSDTESSLAAGKKRSVEELNDVIDRSTGSVTSKKRRRT